MLRINLPIHRWSARPGLSLARGLGLFLAFALHGLAEPGLDGIPSVHEKARYEALRAHSPFSLATEAPPAPAPQASFAANWFVSGIGRIGDADYVTIKSRDQSQEFSLYGREINVNSVALVSVTWSDNVGKSTVILRKGTETARLEFNEAELRAVPPPPAGAAAPVAANVPHSTGIPVAALGSNGVPPNSAIPRPAIAPLPVRRRVAPIRAPR
jgi:hypothetical protein